MFKDLGLKAVYSSDKDDFAKEFYNPILSEAITFDRTSAYFSAKALALYAEGLEYFAMNGNKYRLLVSKDISEEDYNELQKGYRLRTEITQNLIDSISLEELNLEEERRLSNLAYLIAKGVMDVKIAFKTKGIFHDKTGIVRDKNGDKICFKGSNNETPAAVEKNYETLQLMCSWLDIGNFYNAGIQEAEEDFETLWNNENNEVTVLPVEEVVMNEIMKYNKGELIVETAIMEKDAVVLDYANQLVLYVNTESINWLTTSAFYKMRLKSKVAEIKGNKIFFKTGLTYPDYVKIGAILAQKIPPTGHKYIETERLKQYIEERNLYIRQRAKLGIELKTDATRLDNRYLKFKEIVDRGMHRKLRDKQMQDAFFMYAMSKSGNFSVPGSGKTSSALGVYTYLKQYDIVDKIVMIGPKNSFGSWIDEFNACFKTKEELRVFNIHDPKYKNIKERKYALEFESGLCNLFLFNYESLGSYVKELSQLVSSKTLLVFDEVHKVKRVDGTYANNALVIAENALYTIAMTGTPLPNSYRDLYNLLHILYNDEYKEFFNFDLPLLDNPTPDEVEKINDKIQPFFCRTSKRELNVPESNEDMMIETLAQKSEQKLFEILCKKYRRNKLALVIRILQLETNPNLLLQKLDLNDFANILDIQEDIEEVDFIDASKEVLDCIANIGMTTKKKRCIELISTLVSEKKTVVLWCIFKNTIASMEEELNKLGIKAKCIYGEITDLQERNDILEGFKNGKFDVLITNPHTLAESVSLHSICHDAVYYEYSYNLVHLLQSKDRIHRLGLPEGQYTQYYFMAQYYDNLEHSERYSLDVEIYERLKLKEQRMLDAIDNHQLEPVYTTDEDLDLIFKNL